MGKRSQSKSGSNSDDSVRNIVENAGRFKAFISYSHEDFRDAARLHKRLENYALPKHLRSLDADDPLSAKGRLGRFFRDREDLPAAQDLTESVKQALAASKALIVLCSPDSRASPWVTREVQLFQELHPDRPILAAILRGEPDQSIPEILRQGGEPLAADLRKEGDGARLGFLKIVAGLAEVPLDALIQRDTQRHLRRVTAVTVMALAAMLVMALMTTIALQARNEAQRQREGAEGLVEFMLSELREDLRKVGRVETMASVSREALDYYSGQSDLSAIPQESLLRRAKALQALGEDITTMQDGNLIRALELFVEAHRATEEALRRNPNDADCLFGHGQSAYWIGYIDELRDDYAGAHIWYGRYRQLAQKLARIEPGNARSMMELGFGDLNMGIMSLRSDMHDRAAGEFSDSIDWFREALRVAKKKDGANRELANAYSWLSNTYYEQEKFELAHGAQQNAADIKRAIYAADIDNMAARFDVLIAERALVMSKFHLGDQVGARKEVRRLAHETAELSKSDPKNREWAEFSRKMELTIKTIGRE